MRTFTNGTRTCLDEQGGIHTFHYSILIEERELDGFFCEDLGIRIEEEGGASAEVRGITTRRERIEELMDLLTACAAAPTDLSYVVEDWL